MWQRVAEDFAPFNVDVTTEDPGFDAIDRANAGDSVYGTRVVITDTASESICGDPCGGVAYVDVFDKLVPIFPHAYYQPAFVFSSALSSAKSVAEATSHEAGHNLALLHDGTPTLGYYSGHGAWAPIMGVGYSRPISQWSQGEYANANNAEDDVAIIALSGAPMREDDHGDTAVTSTPLSAPPLSANGFIGSRADVDVFSFSTAAGLVTVTVDPWPNSPNLDVLLELRDGSGTLLAASDPPAAMITTDSAMGLAATVQAVVSSGTYYVHVTGVGFGDQLNTGYSDYGSLGSYSLTGGIDIPVCNTLTPTTFGDGSFTLNPANSVDCSPGQYYAGESISLDATPAAGWQLYLWSAIGGGSFADANAEDTVFTMPAGGVTVLATFVVPLDCSAGECSFSFDSDGGWTFSGLWHVETGAAISGMNGAMLAFNQGCTGSGVSGCTYDTGAATDGFAIFPDRQCQRRDHPDLLNRPPGRGPDACLPRRLGPNRCRVLH